MSLVSLRKMMGSMAVFMLLGMVLIPQSGEAAEQQSLRVTVTAIAASNEGHDFDLDNDAYRHQLINLFSYSSYKQERAGVLLLNKSERSTFELKDGYELVLTYMGEENGRVMVQAIIRKGSQKFVETVLSIVKPGTAFLGGPQINSGSLIIVLETGF